MKSAALVLITMMMFVGLTHAQMIEVTDKNLEPVMFLLGKWTGEGTGVGGTAHVEHIYEPVIRGNFIQMRTVSVDSLGQKEIHEDWGFFSFDSDRKELILRQFLSEGFVNTYFLEKSDEKSMVFTSESTESAGGVKARLRFDKIDSENYELELELAPPGKDFFSCRKMKMKRVHVH